MHTSDIRSTSQDPRYAGVVFSGPIDEAIKQAKAAPDFGPSRRARSELLDFLRISVTPPSYDTLLQRCDRWDTEQDRDCLIP